MGGYFGGRLLEVGRDVTFLVRPRRAAQLAERGLVIKSPCGDALIGSPPTVGAGQITAPYDLVVVGCKAYDLDDAIESIAPAVGENTAILPLLNGMNHLDRLEARFGARRVFGGVCLIASTLSERGEIVHLNDAHALVFGARTSGEQARVEAISKAFSGANFVARASAEIVLEMWEKWVFIATLAGSTCLMRGAVGDIGAAGATPLIVAMLDECRQIAERAGFAPRPDAVDRMMGFLTMTGSPLTASMLRDVEAGARVEADHVLGDMLARAPQDWPQERSLLRLAYLHLKTYEARRQRVAATPKAV
jgi:2-dehydropantoate 2-reductase